MTIIDCGGWLEDQLPTITALLGPSRELGFVFQVSTAFTAIGLAIAFYRRRRNPELDTFTITTAWTLLGAFLGLLVVVVEALLAAIP
jgi:uncharacterized membrane protein YfcA